MAYPSVTTALLLLAVLLSFGCARGESSSEATTQKAVLGGRTFHLELALTEDARYRGLGGRDRIADDGGMLFVMPETKIHGFVMRDCLVDIDILFLDGTGRIVSMAEMKVEPPDTQEWQRKIYISEWPAQFVIELRGGMIRELGLRNGQKIDLPLAELKRRAA